MNIKFGLKKATAQAPRTRNAVWPIARRANRKKAMFALTLDPGVEPFVVIANIAFFLLPGGRTGRKRSSL